MENDSTEFLWHRSNFYFYVYSTGHQVYGTKHNNKQRWNN